ncbi:MAG: aquaporin Z [Flavobacteriaceae bacterium]|nr:aquaporin Z [Flavobacteriaceae bacterium]
MKKFLAEMLGTFVLVFIGCGSAVIAGGNVGFLGIAFAFGISVLTMVYAIGAISGCHINPAITVAMLFAGKISGKDAGGYMLFQVIGAILGAGVLYLVAQGLPGYDIAVNGLGQNGYGTASPEDYDMTAAFVAEVVLTAIFLLVIFGATHKDAPGKFAGLAIGLALTMIHIVGIPITGTSVNPARSIGPAIFVGGQAISQLWLFIVAPVLGGILGAILWKFVLGKD